MKTGIKVLHWIPRIICILAILFISLFALDSFSPDLTIWQQIGAFLIHLIPSFVLLALLIVAWKWEFIGGIIFTAISIGFSPVIYLHNFKMNQSIWMSISIVLVITFPFVIAGIIFIVGHIKKTNQNS
jgi:hypothetical protein